MRRQASQRLLHSGTGGAESPVSEEAAGDDDSLAALAGRVVSQQEQIVRLTSDLDAANAKRGELAKVRSSVLHKGMNCPSNQFTCTYKLQCATVLKQHQLICCCLY
jgi:hypothetical protein